MINNDINRIQQNAKSYVILAFHISINLSHFTEYHIMQIVRGEKRSRFSRISLQSRRFSSKFFYYYYMVFRIAVQSRKFSRE